MNMQFRSKNSHSALSVHKEKTVSKPIWTQHVDALVSQLRREANRKLAKTLREKSIRHKIFGLEVRAHLAANDSSFASEGGRHAR